MGGEGLKEQQTIEIRGDDHNLTADGNMVKDVVTACRASIHGDDQMMLVGRYEASRPMSVCGPGMCMGCRAFLINRRRGVLDALYKSGNL